MKQTRKAALWTTILFVGLASLFFPLYYGLTVLIATLIAIRLPQSAYSYFGSGKEGFYVPNAWGFILIACFFWLLLFVTVRFAMWLFASPNRR